MLAKIEGALRLALRLVVLAFLLGLLGFMGYAAVNAAFS